LIGYLGYGNLKGIFRINKFEKNQTGSKHPNEALFGVIHIHSLKGRFFGFLIKIAYEN